MDITADKHPALPHKGRRRLRGLSKVDGRSKLGRFIRDTCDELLSGLGPKPSPAQRILVQTIAIKAARLSQIEADLIKGAAQAGPEDYQRLAWLNSLSKDLAELGLKPQRDGKGYRAADKQGDAGRPAPQRDGGTLADYAAKRKTAA